MSSIKIPEFDTPELDLVSQILRQACDDIWLHPRSSDSSLKFFLSTDYYYGSFLWCCEILDLKPSYIKGQIASRLSECLTVLEQTSTIPIRKRINTSKLLDLLSPKKE